MADSSSSVNTAFEILRANRTWLTAVPVFWALGWRTMSLADASFVQALYAWATILFAWSAAYGVSKAADGIRDNLRGQINITDDASK